MANLLLSSGANLKATTDRGDTALSIARAKGDARMVKVLGTPGA
jgi:ankyrin repeat protein